MNKTYQEIADTVKADLERVKKTLNIKFDLNTKLSKELSKYLGTSSAPKGVNARNVEEDSPPHRACVGRARDVAQRLCSTSQSIARRSVALA